MKAVHEVSQSSFTANASLYDVARPSYIPSAVDTLCDRCNITPSSRVLDLAAGTGIFTRLLHARGVNVVACDPSPGMRETFSARSSIEIHDGSAYHLPFGDAMFDVVTIAQAFHWFADSDALREINRVLRPGGYLAMIWNLEDYNTRGWQDEYFSAVVRHDDGLPQYRHGIWKQALRQTSFFEPYEQRMERFDLWYSEEELWARARSKSFITSLPPSQQDELRHELSDIIKRYPDAERKEGRLKCPHYVRVVTTRSKASS